MLRVWSGSDWAEGFHSRKSCSEGCARRQGLPFIIGARQAQVARSAGEAELTDALKGASEAVGVMNAVKDCLARSGLRFSVWALALGAGSNPTMASESREGLAPKIRQKTYVLTLSGTEN